MQVADLADHRFAVPAQTTKMGVKCPDWKRCTSIFLRSL